MSRSEAVGVQGFIQPMPLETQARTKQDGLQHWCKVPCCHPRPLRDHTLLLAKIVLHGLPGRNPSGTGAGCTRMHAASFTRGKLSGGQSRWRFSLYWPTIEVNASLEFMCRWTMPGPGCRSQDRLLGLNLPWSGFVTWGSSLSIHH